MKLDVLYNEECLAGMGKLPACSVDAVVTDPPYHLTQLSRNGSPRSNNPATPFGRTAIGAKGFMGKTWDGGDLAHRLELWREVLRVLKPGGHLLSFGGTRTYHRLAVAIEDAGFEVRDQLAWIYGSGFPKSQDVGKAIDKRGGNPHLAHEIGLALGVARKQRGIAIREADQLFCNGSTNWTWFEGRPSGIRAPTSETFARISKEWPEVAHLAALVDQVEREVTGISVNKSGIGNGTTGHYTVGGTRAEHTLRTAPATDAAKQWNGWGSALKPALEPICLARKPLSESTIAANVLRHSTGALNVDGCRIGTGGIKYDAPGDRGQHGKNRQLGFANSAGTAHSLGRWPANLLLDEEAAHALDEMSGTLHSHPGTMRTESTRGGYCGLSTRKPGTVITSGDSGGASRFFKVIEGSRMIYCAKASKRERGPDCTHPTVKPLKLMEYLVRLICPPGGIVLDPFMGSGSTALACISEGFHYIGFERDKEYFKIAQNRIAQHKPKEVAVAA